MHEYLYQNKIIYFVTINASGAVEKKIEVCKDIQDAEFTYANKQIKTAVTIGEIEYTNSFNI